MKKRMSGELKILIWTLVIGIVSMIGHNLFYALGEGFPRFKVVFNVFEVGLFFLTLISALVFFIVVVYTGGKYLIKGEPKGAWNIGWIGLVLMTFFIVVGMNSFYFYVFAGVLMLFLIPRVKRMIWGNVKGVVWKN